MRISFRTVGNERGSVNTEYMYAREDEEGIVRLYCAETVEDLNMGVLKAYIGDVVSYSITNV